MLIRWDTYKRYLKLGFIVGGVATKDEPLGWRGVRCHAVVCYGGPEWFPDRIGEKVELCLLKVLGRNALLSSDCNGLRT